MFQTDTTSPMDDKPESSHGAAASQRGPKQMRLHPVIAKIKNKETGLAAQLWEEVKASHPNNPLKQISAFYSEFQIPAAIGRKRRASLQTHQDYQDRLSSFVRELRNLNMPVKNLDEMSKKQVRLVFLHLEKEGRSAAWMANVNTAVRRFGVWIGKPELCPPLGQIVSQPWSGKRRIAAQKDRTWSQEDVTSILEKVSEVCPMTALHLRLARLFGHRVQEFLMFRPVDAIQGDAIHLVEGTKGGRTRIVPIETEEQRKWLDVAVQIAAENPKGRLMAQDGFTLVQARNHFYYVLRRCGITKNDIDMTAHGLRHSYACDLYEAFTGAKAPIQGGPQVDAELDNRARVEIARRLGHGRKSVTTAYLGSHAALRKYARENLQRIEHQVKNDEALQTLIRAAGLDSLCLVGAVARGDTLGSNEHAMVAYAAKAQAGETQQQADIRAAGQVMAICAQLSQTLGRRVCLESLSDIPESEDRFELT